MIVAEAYLERIRKIDALIRNKLIDLERLLEEAESIGGSNLGERVLSSRNLHRGADTIGSYVDIEAEIISLRSERESILRIVERLPTAEYEVIHMLYVEGLSIKEISFHNHKSYEWVKKRKKAGLNIIQSLLNNTACS